MALAGNNNLNPNKTVSPDDLKAIARNAASKATADVLDKWLEDRKKANAELDDPDHGKKVAQAAAEKTKAEAAKWVPGSDVGRFDPLAEKDPTEMSPFELSRMFARSIHCMVHALSVGGGVDAAVELADRHGQKTLSKALGAQDFDSGGFLLEPMFVDGFIEELTPKEIYMRALPASSMIEMPEGGGLLPYEDDGADADFVAENTEVDAEEITGGQLVLQPRIVAVDVPASNAFLRGAPGKSDQYIMRSMQKGVITKIGATLLRGVGVSNQFKGLAGLMASGNEGSVTAEAGLTQAILVEELIYPQTVVEEANVDFATSAPFYFMSPRSKNYMRAQRATDGYLFPEMETSNKLIGAGYDATGNIPNNVSASYSEIYFVALAHMLLARTQDMLFEVFRGGTYSNSSGTLVSGISARQTVFSLTMSMDHVATQRGNEIYRLNDVDWT